MTPRVFVDASALVQFEKELAEISPQLSKAHNGALRDVVVAREAIPGGLVRTTVFDRGWPDIQIVVEPSPELLRALRRIIPKSLRPRSGALADPTGWVGFLKVAP